MEPHRIPLQRLLDAFPLMPIGPTNLCTDKNPKGHKRPAVVWRDMLTSKTEELASAAARGNPDKFGRTGKDFGVFVVDIDVQDGGVAAWDALCFQASPVCFPASPVCFPASPLCFRPSPVCF